MAFAKPVIGTIVPAPAYFASFSYKCRQVSRAPRKHHHDGGRGGCVLGIQSAGEPQLPYSLADRADRTANQKRQQAVAPQRRIRAFALEQLLIGLFIQFHARFPFLYA